MQKACHRQTVYNKVIMYVFVGLLVACEACHGIFIIIEGRFMVVPV